VDVNKPFLVHQRNNTIAMPKTTDTVKPEFSIELAQTLFDSEDAFPVDLDDAWVWLGYAEKRNALRKLTSHFEEKIDYLDLARSGESLETEGFGNIKGSTPDKYSLTVECFKHIAMLAETAQGREVRKYFIECEKVAKLSGVKVAILEATIADLQKQLAEALNAPKASTRNQQIVERPDPAKYIQALRCEAARIWAVRGLYDAEGARAEMVSLDRAADAYLASWGTLNTSPSADIDLSSVLTAATFLRKPIHAPRHLPENLKISSLKLIPRMRDGKLTHSFSQIDARNIFVALKECMKGFDELYLHGGELVGCIFTQDVIDQINSEKFTINCFIGRNIKAIGYEKTELKKYNVGDSRYLDQATFVLYSKIGGAV
jgi:phage anti-repressor protein